MPDSDVLLTAAQALYAGPTETFIARRKEAVSQAKGTGAKELASALAALRRPTVAAAAVNAMPQKSLDELSDLASRLRAAASAPNVEALKELSTERTHLLARLVAEAGVSSAVGDEVRATLTAALADPEAEAAVRSRTLVRALTYSGFGTPDMRAAVAVPHLRIVRSAGDIDKARTALDVARRRQAAAQEAVDAAHAALDRANLEVADAQKKLSALDGL